MPISPDNPILSNSQCCSDVGGQIKGTTRTTAIIPNSTKTIHWRVFSRLRARKPGSVGFDTDISSTTGVEETAGWRLGSVGC